MYTVLSFRKETITKSPLIYQSTHASSSLLSITTRALLLFRRLVALFWLPCSSFNSSVCTALEYFSTCSRILLPYLSVFNFPMIFSNCKKNWICYDYSFRLTGYQLGCLRITTKEWTVKLTLEFKIATASYS